jgi:hypothetical protein
LWNELSLAFEMRRVSTIVPGSLKSRLDPKTEPRMIPPMNRVIKEQIGMVNLFLRYH